jgi:hypothetical protein
MKCNLCNNKIDTLVFSMSQFPNVGDFLKYEDVGREYLRNLTVYYCDNCKSMQIKETVNKKRMYKNYLYKTHDMNTLKNHFYENAIDFSNYIKDKNVNILEIGGNSCPFGEKIIELGFKNFINFDPSGIALKYKPQNCNLINDFFTEKNSKKLLFNKKFDYIFSSNNFAHVRNIHDFIKGIVYVSHNKTELTIEVQSLEYLINSICYPFFYHEHVYYYSEYSLIKLLEPYEFYIKKLNIINVHGKSLQITFTKDISQQNIKLKNNIFSKKEIVFNKNVILDFNKKIINEKIKLNKFIKNNKNKKIAFYGASGQANVFLSFNFLNKDIKNYPIIDDSKLKQGLFTPKTHLKIYPSEYLKEFKPDFIIILAYNFYKEIIEKNKNINTKWIIPLPTFQIL